MYISSPFFLNFLKKKINKRYTIYCCTIIYRNIFVNNKQSCFGVKKQHQIVTKSKRPNEENQK